MSSVESKGDAGELPDGPFCVRFLRAGVVRRGGVSRKGTGGAGGGESQCG